MNVSNDWWPRFSDAEYAGRYRRIREAMAARDLDCLLVYGTPMFFGTDPGAPNLVYLTSYVPALQGYVVFPREGDPTLIQYVNTHLPNARLLSVIPDIRAGTDVTGNAIQRVRELGYEKGKIGIVGSFAGWAGISVPHEHHLAFSEHLPEAQFEVVTSWYEDIRILKSAEEISYMEAGAAIADKAHEALREMAKAGVSDMALHNEVLRVTHSLGGRIPFSHVGSTPMRDPSMSYPSYYPTNRIVQWGDVILTETTAGYGGYFGKLFGTLFLGEPTPEYRQMVEIAAEIYHRIYESIRPGMRAGEAQSVLGGRAAQSGYLSQSFYSGWSNYNSRPFLFSKRALPGDSEFVLQPGHCLDLAGWVTTSDERMGAWVGDTAVVTEDGLRPLHSYPVYDLDYITLG